MLRPGAATGNPPPASQLLSSPLLAACPSWCASSWPGPATALRSFIKREALQVINVRQAMAAGWRQRVPDHLWDYLVEKGYVGEVEEDRMPIGDLIEEAQQIRAAARSASSDDNEIARQAGCAAASARIDALSAIYAAWARQDLEVQRFRS